MATISNQLSQVGSYILAKIPVWIIAFAIIVISVIVGKIVRHIVEGKMAQKGMEEEYKEVQVLAGRISYFIVITIGLTIGLKIAGLDLTMIVAALAFGLGFAIKDIIGNFFAGVIILVNKNFKIGDFVMVNGVLGRVVEIQSRVTILQSTDGSRIIVPNTQLLDKKNSSFTGNPFRRIEVVTSVDIRSDLRNVLKVCMIAAKRTKGVVQNPGPAVAVVEFTDSEIDIAVRVWAKSLGGWKNIYSRLMLNLKEAFDEYEIDYPWLMRQPFDDKEIPHGLNVDKKIEDKEMDEEFTAETKPGHYEVAIDLDDGQVLKPIA
ncbi:mechanosensitive ion channel family protein [Candidatus Peregrinibacteria bacterium]|nr:mechanosensitive ion channel family protein [Candidatus Peregrinibacteria bacterium]